MLKVIPVINKLPTWAMGLITMGLVFAGAGAGIALEGEISGETNVVVEQAITVVKGTLTDPDGSTTTTVTVNDLGTKFVAPITIATGDTFTLTLALKNNSEVDAAAEMTVDYPDGFEVDAETTGSKAEVKVVSQTGRNPWLLTIDDDADGSAE